MHALRSSRRDSGRYNPPHAQEAIRRYVELAKAHGLDPSQMALAFINDRPFVTANIIGATSLEQLKADIASIDLVLPPEVLEGIATIYREIPDPNLLTKRTTSSVSSRLGAPHRVAHVHVSPYMFTDDDCICGNHPYTSQIYEVLEQGEDRENSVSS